MAYRSPGRGRSVTLLLVALAAIAAAIPSAALAHAELDTSDPADGAIVEVAPTEIAMTFTQDLDASQSSIVVVTGGGEIASGGEIDPADPRRMTLALPPLEPGVYEVRWTTLSAEDDELERGVTTFTFTPPPPTPTPVPTPTPAPSATPQPTAPPTTPPTAAPSPSPSPSADTAPPTSTTDILIPIVVAVVVVAGFSYWLTRRRSGEGGAP